MKKYALLRYCLVFLAIVLPYFTAAAFHGTEMVLAERKPDMEEYLPILVFSQISPDMKKETIKAQTVIARSNIQRRIGEGKRKCRRSLEIFFYRKKSNLSAVSERDGRAGTDI